MWRTGISWPTSSAPTLRYRPGGRRRASARAAGLDLKVLELAAKLVILCEQVEVAFETEDAKRTQISAKRDVRITLLEAR